MEIKPAMQNALLGINRGMQGLARNAAEIASADSMRNGVPIEPLVDAKMNRLQVEANVTVLKRVDETLGSLLDEKA